MTPRAGRTRASATASVACGVLLAACGGGRERPPAGDVDAGVGAPDAGTTAMYEPTPPAAPMLLACPPAMRPLVLPSGASVCEADPDATPCDAASARFFEAPNCATIGPVCPAGPYAEPEPGVPTLHVLAGAATGGDGSVERPFATIGAALALARAGTTVLVGKGAYHESNLRVPAGVRVLGACVAEATVSATGISAPTALFYTSARAVQIERLTLGPSSGLGLQVEGGALAVHHVLVRDATTAGVSIVRGALTGDHLVVRSTHVDPSFSDAGWGIFAESGGTADLDQLVVEDSGEYGVLAVQAGTAVVVRGAMIRDSRGAPAGQIGGGAHAQDGATIDISGGAIRGTPKGGLAAAIGSHLIARDVAIADAHAPASTELVGFGVNGDTMSDVELERVTVAHTSHTGIVIREASTLRATDVVVHDASVGLGGRDRPMVTGNRIVLEGVASGVLFQGPAFAVDLSDILVRSTTGVPEGGFGLSVGHGGTLTLTRATLQDTILLGVGVNGADITATVSDLLVTDTRSYGAEEQWGQGLDVAGGAHVTLTRARFDGNREVQVAAFGVGTTLDVDHVSIRRALGRSCEATTCHAVAGGSSLGAYDSATVTVHDFEVSDAALCGLQVATDAALDARDGVVSGASIGACVQVPAYDSSRLTAGVTFVENGINVDTSDLPIPQAVTDLGMLE